MHRLRTFAAALLLSLGSAFAGEDEGQVLEIMTVSDADGNASIRGQVQVYIGDMFHWYYVDASDPMKNQMLAQLMTAQTTGQNVKLVLSAGVESRILRLTLKK